MNRFATKSYHSEMVRLSNALENLIANLGSSKDKKSYSRFSSRLRNERELTRMYTDDWVSRKVIDTPSNEMTRKWREFTSAQLDPEVIKRLKTVEKRKLKTKKRFNTAIKRAENHGGALIYLGIKGTGDPATPLDLERVTPGSLQFLNVIEKQYVTPVEINVDKPTEPNYKRPTWYENGKYERIHYTRVLTFDGSEVPFEVYKKNGYWCNSLLTAGWDSIVNSQTFADIVVSLAFEAKVDIVQIDGLMHKLSTAKGTQDLQDRFGMADALKSINNMLLLDKNEMHNRAQTNFSGLEGLLKTYLNIVCAAFDIPAHRLLGMSAPGLNSSGDSDTDNYYDMIASKQEDKLDDNLNYYDEIFLRSELGSVPDDWESTWVPLYQISKVEQADIDLKNAQRDSLYRGTVPSSVIVKELQAQGTYQFIDDDLVADLEGLEGLDRAGENTDTDTDTDTDTGEETQGSD